MTREQVVTALIAEMREAQDSRDFLLAGLMAEASEWVQNGGPASELARLRAELAEVARAICEQAADVIWISETETVVDRIYSTLGVEDADHLDREFPARAEGRES